jgi:amino-acid N-acetyltransferase
MGGLTQLVTALTYRRATYLDEPPLRVFLEGFSLPTDDLSAERQDFLLACEGGQIIGSVALEPVGSDALIRSLAVTPQYRGSGLGVTLCDRAVETARNRGLGALYLLTMTAREFFLRRGFEVIGRSEVPAGILALPEFKSLCPATATCMRMDIGGMPSTNRDRR